MVVSLDRFVADLEMLLAEPVSGGVTPMRVRFVRSWAGQPLARAAMARVEDSELKVLLLPADASPRTHPSWECFVDPTTDLEAWGQRCLCDVLGVAALGRGVALRRGEMLVPAASPLRPVLRGRKFGTDDW